MAEITAKVDVHFPNGDKTIEMLLKDPHDIEECPEGSVVILNLTNDEQHTGIFKGMSDDDIKLGSLDGKHTLGYKIIWLEDYFEEIKR